MRIRVTGYSPERFLNLCSSHDILIWDLQNKDDSYEMYMTVKGFRKLLPIVRKTRTKVRIIRRCGMPFLLYRYRKRKVFMAGLVLGSILIYALSLFIWDIEFEGNSVRTSEVLMKFLEENHIFHGVMKREVNCEQVESMLRNEFDDIIWASVEMKGTRLIIHVQESLDIEQADEVLSEEPSDLCADCAGTIDSIITRAGTPLVSAGTPVEKGDVLVQGRMEILDDNGEVANYQYCAADADIYIRTDLPYENSFSRVYTVKKYEEKLKKSYYIKTFSRKWNFGLSNNEDGQTSELVIDEKQLHLWNHFYLPFYFGSETRKYYTNIEKTYTEEQARAKAEKELRQYCEDLEKKGVQIVENSVTILVDENICSASGMLTVIEKTGKRQPVQSAEISAEPVAEPD